MDTAEAPAAAPAEETVDVVDAAPAAGSDGAGAADTATEEVMDTGHSSDEDSLPPTPVEAAAPVTNNEGEQAGGEGADGGEADGEATVENDAAEAEAGAEVEMEAEEATSPSDATDPQVQKFVDGWKDSISEQETSRKAVLGWLSRAFPSDAEGGVTAASGDAAKDDSGDRIVLNEGYDST